MALNPKPNKTMLKAYKKWLAGRPPHVRVVAEKYPPWQLYRMKNTGQRVILHSFDEHDDKTVTLKVDVLEQFNGPLFMERRVFGVRPDDLEKVEDM